MGQGGEKRVKKKEMEEGVTSLCFTGRTIWEKEQVAHGAQTKFKRWGKTGGEGKGRD